MIDCRQTRGHQKCVDKPITKLPPKQRPSGTRQELKSGPNRLALTGTGLKDG